MELLAPGWPCQDSNLDHLYGQTEASTEHKTSFGACPSLTTAVLKPMQLSSCFCSARGSGIGNILNQNLDENSKRQSIEDDSKRKQKHREKLNLFI